MRYCIGRNSNSPLAEKAAVAIFAGPATAIRRVAAAAGTGEAASYGRVGLVYRPTKEYHIPDLCSVSWTWDANTTEMTREAFLARANEELAAQGITTHRFVVVEYSLPFLDRVPPPEPPRPEPPRPFILKTSASPGGSIKTDLGPFCSIPVNPDEQEQLTIIIRRRGGCILEKVLVDGEEYVPTDLKDTGDTITFTWPPAGKSITHDPNMYADFKRKKRPAQISGIPSP